ncbi:MAG: hypothetical protein U1F16_14200 [Turneriella sp.]
MKPFLLPELGKSYDHERVFSRADILEFARITGDHGDHHTDPNRRVMAQGLLVASIVTKLGGDMNYVARSMDFEMLKPVYEGEKIRGEVKVTSLVRKPNRLKLAMVCTCFNSAGEAVIAGQSRGLIWLESTAVAPV